MPRLNAAAIAPLLSCFLLAGCSSPTAPRHTPQQSPPAPTYKAGEVIVGFYPDVTEEQAGAMFADLGLSWVSRFPKRFTYFVEDVSGDLDADAAWLSESPIVIFAEHEADYVIVSFNETATTESAQALIDSRPGLHVRSILVAPKLADVSVEPGQEQYWIDVLEKESIVKYAELDRLMQLG